MKLYITILLLTFGWPNRLSYVGHDVPVAQHTTSINTSNAAPSHKDNWFERQYKKLKTARLIKQLIRKIEDNTGFEIEYGAFLLGFAFSLLGFIIVLLAYAPKSGESYKEYYQALISAGIGCLALPVIALLGFLIFFLFF